MATLVGKGVAQPKARGNAIDLAFKLLVVLKVRSSANLKRERDLAPLSSPIFRGQSGTTIKEHR